jgi:hypothetical protein
VGQDIAPGGVSNGEILSLWEYVYVMMDYLEGVLRIVEVYDLISIQLGATLAPIVNYEGDIAILDQVLHRSFDHAALAAAREARDHEH